MYNDMIAKREAKIKELETKIEENRQVFQVSILHQLIWCVSGITKKSPQIRALRIYGLFSAGDRT